MLLHRLQVFIRAVEEKSFSKAAKSIYLSQSTVSTHIDKLEKYFGQKLFDRVGRKIVLTCFGEKVYARAKELILQKEKLLMELRDDTVKIEGHIKIAASTVPAQYLIPKVVSTFSHDYPAIKFSLNMVDSKQAIELLINGEADLAITGYPHFSEKIVYLPWVEEKLVLITPPNIFLESNVTISQIAHYPFLLRKYGSGTQITIEKILQKASVDMNKINVVGYIDCVQVLKQCVKEGLGISIISEIAAADYAQQDFIKVYTLKELTESRNFYIAVNKDRTSSPLANEFINYCLTSKINSINNHLL